MQNISKLLYIAIAVALALSANSVSAIWAKDGNRYSMWFPLLLALSPLVFISFGLVTAKMGVTVTSGILDSLLTILTMLIGIVFFKEWDKISVAQYIGMVFAVVGILLMLFFPKEKTM